MPTRENVRTTTQSRGRLDHCREAIRSARMLLAVTTALVIFGTIFVASASEGQSAVDGGTVFSIMIHDIAYLCLGIFALYLGARVRLDRLVKSAPLSSVRTASLLLAVEGRRGHRQRRQALAEPARDRPSALGALQTLHRVLHRVARPAPP